MKLKHEISNKIIFTIIFFIWLPTIFLTKTIPTYEIILISLINSAFCHIILVLLHKFSPITLSIIFLSIPNIIFFLGWTRAALAVPVTVAIIFIVYKTLKKEGFFHPRPIDAQDLASFIVIAFWVVLSGAGAYGNQFSDHIMHNARLNDLINYAWPVHYDENRNFVYYFGYFLPAALAGKIVGYNQALLFHFLWTTLGVGIAFRWLTLHSGCKQGILIALAMIAFGPHDFIAAIFHNLSEENFSSLRLINISVSDPGHIDFWTKKYTPEFIGAYLSNTFQLFWSPQQIIAGWIFAGVLMHYVTAKEISKIIFPYSLLCIWAPLVMISIFPLIAIITVFNYSNNFIKNKNFLVTLFSLSIIIFFLIFYSGGSININASFWIFEIIKTKTTLLTFFIFMFFSWMIYAITISTFFKEMDKDHIVLYIGIIFSLSILPIRTYGEWSDLLCRGSAPLMFLLLIFMLKTIKYHNTERHHFMTAISCTALLGGSISFILWTNLSIRHYGETQPVASVISYGNAYPNLGPDNTFFRKYLARQ